MIGNTATTTLLESRPQRPDSNQAMFNMSSLRSQDAYAQLPEGLCAMWAVIVVARLDAKLPSWDQAAELETNRDGRWALWARSAFDDFALTFSDYQPDVRWTVLPTSITSCL